MLQQVVANSSILPLNAIQQQEAMPGPQSVVMRQVWRGVAIGGRLKGCTVCVASGEEGEDCDPIAKNSTLGTGQFLINVSVPATQQHQHQHQQGTWRGPPQLLLRPGPGCVDAETGAPVPAPLRCASLNGVHARV